MRGKTVEPTAAARLRAELAAGLEEHARGRRDQADAHYRKALRADPDHPDALHLLGVLETEKGRFERAVQLIGKALARVPDFAEGHSNLGNALRGLGRLEEAEARYRTALRLKPEFPAALSNLARVQVARLDFSGALAGCDRALALDGGLFDAHVNRAHALLGLGLGAEAEASFRAALRLRPMEVETLCALAAHLAETGRLAEARALAGRALEAAPNSLSALCLAGALQRRAGELDAAIETFRRATKLAPRAPAAWTGLGAAMRALGRFDAAEDCLRRALAIDPELAEAHRDLALMGRADRPDRLAGLADDARAPVARRVAAGFALGKLLDDGARYDEAFARYAAANALFKEMEERAGRAFDAGALRGEVDRLIDVFTRTPPRAAGEAGPRDETPVFVVGMPRSGTSLVEQILASHPMVYGAGELSAIGEIVAAEAAAGAGGGGAPAGRHLARLSELSGGKARVIDKMPDNLFHLDAIARLFPGARVIVCSRDPRDVGLSCFFQRFSGSAQLFSYDLYSCGQRAAHTARLAGAWLGAPALPTIEVGYERLVADLEGESRRMVEFLGLPWDAACLEFHKTERAVLTASSWQVRQPLFTAGVGRWRHYERNLSPLLQGLELEGLELGGPTS